MMVGDGVNDASALAAGAMALSSVSVLANSLLFRTYDPDEEYRTFGILR